MLVAHLTDLYLFLCQLATRNLTETLTQPAFQAI